MKIVESEKKIFELLGFPYVGLSSLSALSSERADQRETFYSSSLRSESFQFGKGSLKKLVSRSIPSFPFRSLYQPKAHVDTLSLSQAFEVSTCFIDSDPFPISPYSTSPLRFVITSPNSVSPILGNSSTMQSLMSLSSTFRSPSTGENARILTFSAKSHFTAASRRPQVPSFPL